MFRAENTVDIIWVGGIVGALIVCCIGSLCRRNRQNAGQPQAQQAMPLLQVAVDARLTPAENLAPRSPGRR